MEKYVVSQKEVLANGSKILELYKNGKKIQMEIGKEHLDKKGNVKQECWNDLLMQGYSISNMTI